MVYYSTYYRYDEIRGKYLYIRLYILWILLYSDYVYGWDFILYNIHIIKCISVRIFIRITYYTSWPTQEVKSLSDISVSYYIIYN